MRIFFKAEEVGSPADFVWDDGAIAVGDTDPADWRFGLDGQRHKCVIAASEAAGLNLSLTPGVPQAQFWKKHTRNPAWYRILKKEEFAKFLSQQVQEVVSFVSNDNHRYFTTHFQIQQQLIDSLAQGRVSSDALNAHGFIPDRNGFVPVPGYDNAHSQTGRMSVVSGPKILTLQKDLRSNLISRWPGGNLIEIDYNALETRVLAWMSGLDCTKGDMYAWIGDETGAGVDRGVIKEATLSAMYGMSRRNFALKFQDIPDVLDVYDKVKKILKVQDLDSRLGNMQRFSNAFGRPLATTTTRVSHFVQSSAVDVACHGFWWLINQIHSDWAVPVFLIHDAIVLDVRADHVERIMEICKDGLTSSIIEKNLPVKVRRFNVV